MKKLLVFIFALTTTILVSAQEQRSADFESDKAAVIAVVENFLTAAGNYDLDAIPAIFSKNANIGGAFLRSGEWSTFTMTQEEFLERLRSENNPQKYTEPVSKYTVHISEGMLAFVKADAILSIDGIPRNNNYDFFTLIKEDGGWKILNGSYVSVPIDG